MNTHPVRQSFNRAAQSYAASATLQQQVRQRLLQQAGAALGTDFAGTILDAGCGTGEILKQLHHDFPAATLIGVDFADRMLRQATENNSCYRINADLQYLPIAHASIDLYLSSLAWQWCDIELAVKEAARTLRPNGHLWLTTLINGTFEELADVLYAAGLEAQNHLLSLPDTALVTHGFNQAGLTLQHSQVDAVTTWHQDFNALRRSIRGVGANHVPKTVSEPIGRTSRQALIAAYDRQRTPHGLPLTYHVLTIHAQRRSY